MKTSIVRVLRTILNKPPNLANSTTTNIETLAFFLRLWYTEDIQRKERVYGKTINYM